MSDTHSDVTSVSEENLQREELGRTVPAQGLDLRWRLANGDLPLRERHLRSLADLGVGSPMQSWMRTRLEYVLENHAVENPNGTLHIQMDGEGRTTFEVGPLGETPTLSVADLLERGGAVVGCSVPGTVWLAADNSLIAATDRKLIDAAATTVRDLAKTLGYEVAERPVPSEQVRAQGAEVFLVSDEFGVVAFEGHGGAIATKFTELLNRVLKPPKK